MNQVIGGISGHDMKSGVRDSGKEATPRVLLWGGDGHCVSTPDVSTLKTLPFLRLPSPSDGGVGMMAYSCPRCRRERGIQSSTRRVRQTVRGGMAVAAQTPLIAFFIR